MKFIGTIFLGFILLISSCSQKPKDPAQKLYLKEKQFYTSLLKRDKQAFNLVFRLSQKIFRTIDVGGKNLLTWEALTKEILKGDDHHSISAALALTDYFKEDSGHFRSLFGKGQRLQRGDKVPAELILKNGFYHRGDKNAFAQQCLKMLQIKYPEWGVTRVFGYISPPYQLYRLVNSGSSVEDALLFSYAPYNSNHTNRNPDIGFDVSNLSLSPIAFQKKVLRTCQTVGVRKSPFLKTTFQVLSANELYQASIRSEKVPHAIKNSLLKSFENLHFYPSTEAVKTILALGYQESGLSWNPKVGAYKMAALLRKFEKRIFHDYFGVGILIGKLLLNNDLKEEKSNLHKKLKVMKEKDGNSVTELDIYLWSRDLNKFFINLKRNYHRLYGIGNYVLDFEKIEKQLYHEPQTFGLWQVNVNHFQERLLRHKKYRSQYQELFKGQPTSGELRDRLVHALSGNSEYLSHQKTIELIIQLVFQPRYENHFTGLKEDLDFFAIEHLAGEMSTYRAMLQHVLNQKEGVNLIEDGDLAIYDPYSLKINWTQSSKTQKALRRWIEKNSPSWWKKHQKDKIRAICRSNTKDELLRDALYLDVMEKRRGDRSVPKIKSDLYKQSAKRYLTKIKEKKKILFRHSSQKNSL